MFRTFSGDMKLSPVDWVREAALGLGHPASRVDLIPECNSKCGICVGHNVPSLKQKLVGGLEHQFYFPIYWE